MAIDPGTQYRNFGGFDLGLTGPRAEPGHVPDYQQAAIKYGPGSQPNSGLRTPEPTSRNLHGWESQSPWSRDTISDQLELSQIVPFAEDFNTADFHTQAFGSHGEDRDRHLRCSIELDSSFEQFLYSDLDAYDDFWHSLVLVGNLDKPSSPDFDAVWATTVQHYVTRVWPNSIQAIRTTFNVIQNCLLYRKHAQEAVKSFDGTLLVVKAYPGSTSTLVLILEGNGGDVADVCEALTWQATNVQVGKDPRQPSAVFTDLVASSGQTSSILNQSGPTQYAFALRTRIISDIVPKPGSCWKTLFPRTPCAGQFWRPQRPAGMLGLEVTFDLMCFLAGLEYSVVHDGGIILYGKSSMVYPVFQTRDGVQWHFQELDYKDQPISVGARLLVEDLDILKKATRHFLGLWLDARVRLGTNECDGSDIRSSSVAEVKSILSKDGLSIGSAMATPKILNLRSQNTFKIARSRRNRHMINFELSLRERVTMPILLYCPSEKRAWMVPYVSVLLHMARARAKREADGRCVIPACKTSNNSGYAAFSRIRDCRDQSLHHDAQGTASTVRQHIDNLTARLEMARREICRARAIYPDISESLFGFDFTDIASENSSLKLKRHDLSTSSKRRGWTPLLGDIQLVLFCENLSDPLLPGGGNDFSGPCGESTWKTVPVGFDILAAYLPCLTFFAEDRNLTGLKRLTTENYWSCRHQLFGNCIRTDPHTCSRLQELSKRDDNCPSIPIKLAKENGVAIFRYKEKTNGILADMVRRGVLDDVQQTDSRYSLSSLRSRPSSSRMTPVSTPDTHTRETSRVSNLSSALTNSSTLVTRPSTRQSKFSMRSGKESPLSLQTQIINSPQSQHRFDGATIPEESPQTPQTPQTPHPNPVIAATAELASLVAPLHQETTRYYRKSHDEKRKRSRWNCFSGVT